MVHTETGATVEAPGTRQAESSPSIADPAPLGLAAFAMTTFVLSVFNAKLITSTTLEAVVLPLALFYGGFAQLLAGMWEFRKGNTFGALAFSSFGAFWLSYAAYVKFVAPTLGGNAATATGLYLLAWTIFTAYMTVAAARVNAAVLGVFVFLTLTFLFLTIAEYSGSAPMGKVGGWLGLVTAAVAWYASFAGVTNFTWKRTILPVFPLSPAPHH
ncbi:MAG TPA: acetate uptake transporter [Amycolatopsis sp.]|nr:acetate uptake transporter [Amycolatopsis sp.]